MGTGILILNRDGGARDASGGGAAAGAACAGVVFAAGGDGSCCSCAAFGLLHLARLLRHVLLLGCRLCEQQAAGQ